MPNSGLLCPVNDNEAHNSAPALRPNQVAVQADLLELLTQVIQCLYCLQSI